MGLGQYAGGELVVESVPNDILYCEYLGEPLIIRELIELVACTAPLEFDGWKQVHWTLPFVGERFSLVRYLVQSSLLAMILKHLPTGMVHPIGLRTSGRGYGQALCTFHYSAKPFK